MEDILMKKYKYEKKVIKDRLKTISEDGEGFKGEHEIMVNILNLLNKKVIV